MQLPFNTRAEIVCLLTQDKGYRTALDNAREDTAYLANEFKEDVSRVTGWAHNFVCPHCTKRLDFDLHLNYDRPHSFHCSHCGCETPGNTDLDTAWVYLWRIRCARMLESAAVCAVMGDEDAVDVVCRYVDFYAQNYESFGEHIVYPHKSGHIMLQGLDEACFVTAILRAVAVCETVFPEKIAERKPFWFEKLFLPTAILLLEQSRTGYNIEFWERCAVGMIGIIFNDAPLLTEALESEHGIREKIRRGFTADGIWHECSTHYHYYAVEALANFLAIYRTVKEDDELFGQLETFITAPMALSHDGYALVSLNDGWYPLNVADTPSLREAVLRAERFCGGRDFVRLASRLRYRTTACYETPVSLLYTPVDTAPIVMEASNLAVIKTPIYAILKSGVLLANHRHTDYLSLMLPPFSDDLGTPGYGHPATESWYRSCLSHNTVSVDGKQPANAIHSYIRATERGAIAKIDGGEWEGVLSASRELEADGNSLTDTTILTSDGVRLCRWSFHSDGTAVYSCSGVPSKLPENGEDGSYLSDVMRMDAFDSFTAEYTLPDGRALKLTVSNTNGMEIYTAKSPGNPFDLSRSTLLLYQKTEHAEFRICWCQSMNRKKQKDTI